MKKVILLFSLLLFGSLSHAQIDSEAILDSMLNQLHEMDNIQYRIIEKMKGNYGFKIDTLKGYQKRISPDSLYNEQSIHGNFSDGYIIKNAKDSLKTIFDGDYFADIRQKEKLAKVYDNTIKQREYHLPVYTKNAPFFMEREFGYYRSKGYNKLFDEVYSEVTDEYYVIRLKANNRHVLGNINVKRNYSTLKKIKIGQDTFRPVQYKSAGIKATGDTTYIWDYYYDKYTIKDKEIDALASIPEDYDIQYIDPNPNPRKISNGSQAPLWSLPGLKVDTVNLEKLRNKRILLQFTSMNCGFCIKSIPFINKLNELASTNESLKLLTIFPQSKDPEKLLEFKDKHDFEAPILYDANKIREKYDINGFPTFVIINEKGLIDYIKVGYKKEFKEEIKENFLY